MLFSAHELNALIGALDRVLYLGNGKAVLGTIDEVSPRRCSRSSTNRDRRGTRRRPDLRHVTRPRRRARPAQPRACARPGHGLDMIRPSARSDMLEYEFMNNALAAGGIVAVVRVSSDFSWCCVARLRRARAGHVGFAGATGAVLIGIAPIGVRRLDRRRRRSHGGAR